MCEDDLTYFEKIREIHEHYINLLEQIRQKINNDMHKAIQMQNPNTEFAFGLQHALDIIDKHIR